LHAQFSEIAHAFELFFLLEGSANIVWRFFIVMCGKEGRSGKEKKGGSGKES
jgi:hypothetical protein